MVNIKGSKYTCRLLARVVVEAKTPLAIGTGEKDIFTDSLVATDVNGLPYIPGSSIAGVVRAMIDSEKKSLLFGYQEKKLGHGSEIMFTEARILDSTGTPVDGIVSKTVIQKDPLLEKYSNLPIRNHVRLSDKGTAADMGKFDEQIVFAGSRFCFEIEIVSDQDGVGNLEKVLQSLKSNSFRLGGGTRKGFGEISIVELKSRTLDLTQADNLELYIAKSSNLKESGRWTGWEDADKTATPDEQWDEYSLTLRPEDFILFGSGLGDEEGDADMTTVKASKVEWSCGIGELKEQLVLIPATSLKGALRHRTAYHYNRVKGVKAEDLSAGDVKSVLVDNEAEIELFGQCKDDKITRGNVIFNDIIEGEVPSKIMQHIAVDKFTGGTISGALFAEQVDYAKGNTFKTTILVNKDVKAEFVNAFELSLKDLVNGLLPLGGGVNRGHGFFQGAISKNGLML